MKYYKKLRAIQRPQQYYYQVNAMLENPCDITITCDGIVLSNISLELIIIQLYNKRKHFQHFCKSSNHYTNEINVRNFFFFLFSTKTLLYQI